MAAQPINHNAGVKNSHYKVVIEAIKQGIIIPVLSSDINLCGRPQKMNCIMDDWQKGNYPPSSYELAVHLAKIEGSGYLTEINCPLCNITADHLPESCPLNKTNTITKIALANVSQYLALSNPKTLDSTIRNIIKSEYLPNPVHKFLAKLPDLLKQKNYGLPYPLIVTTCLDSVLEQSFIQTNQDFDLVAFIGNDQGGKFQHTIFKDGSVAESIAIDKSQTYDRISLKQNPVILKLYGGVNIGDGKKFTISEDHFLDYLTQRRIEEFLPSSLLAALQEKNRRLWFLEYSPSHWNLRLILHRIWREQLDKKDKEWWAIQEHPEYLDARFWDKYGVNATHIDSLEAYITELEKRLEAEPPRTSSENDFTNEQSIPKPPRTGVFISYSHKDKEWLETFKEMYGTIQENSLWDDTKIQPGMRWEEEIKKALASAKVAVLLVSKNFLNSKFITQNEVPPLLDAAEKEGLTIFWIYLSDCRYDSPSMQKSIPLAQYQAAHDIRQPLATLGTPLYNNPQLDTVLKEICDKLDKAINS